MNKDKILYWLPRLLAIAFTLFIGVFAFDVFGTGELWYMQIVGFFIHLIPNYILIVALIIAWRNEKIGGAVFLLLYIAALFFFRAEMIGVILFSPLIIIGILFLFNAKQSSIKDKK